MSRYLLCFLCALGFWLLGWAVILGAGLLFRRKGEGARPLHLLDRDDFREM